SYRAVVEALLARNVVPVLSTLPPRRDKQEARDNVPEMNAVVRLVARRHELPVMDLFQALDPLPRGGLQSDGVHPAAFQDDRARPCWFDEQGLQAGMNRRNLLVLESLDQLRRQVLGAEAAPAQPALAQGEGTWERPWTVEAPGVWNASTEGGPSTAVEYGCGKGKLEGRERVHRVEVKGAGRLRVRLFGGGRRGLRWLKEPRPEACVARAISRLDVAVTPGEYWLAVDGAGPGDEGPYGLTLVLRGDP
ncbi:MAG: SGNH/GDSL hydrolase family protein, partial [Polyangiaceae bacterium]|nr:SGNH/GDSL hydrolase family protein [Polyangiaceae bacterium]